MTCPGSALWSGLAQTPDTLREANNYADTLVTLQHFEEAKSLLLKTLPLSRRVLGESDDTTLRMRTHYAWALYSDPGATLEDLREAVTMLEETARTTRRVFGGAYPTTERIEQDLQEARAALRARVTPSKSP